jgi:hypothetical protein
MKIIKTCLKIREEDEQKNGNIIGVNLYRVCCTHVWNDHNEITHIIDVLSFKNKTNNLKMNEEE